MSINKQKCQSFSEILLCVCGLSLQSDLYFVKYLEFCIFCLIDENDSISQFFSSSWLKILYAYLLILLRDNHRNALISKQFSFLDTQEISQRAKITTTQKHVLQLLKKPLGGSNYNQLRQSNMKLAKCLLSCSLYIKQQDKPVVGASSLIDLNINENTDRMTIHISELYLYYLIISYRHQLTQVVDKRWARYTLLDLQERFQLTSELQKFVHEWLSHDIFPNDNAYKINVNDIVQGIKSNNMINNFDDKR